MKYFLSALLLSVVIIPVPLSAKITSTKIVTLTAIPSDIKGFLALRDELSLTPEGGAIVMLAALMKFTQDQDLGSKFIVIALDRKHLVDGDVYKDYAIARSITEHLHRLTLPEKKHIPWTYVQGATPELDYQTDLPYTFKVIQNSYSVINADTIKVYIHVWGIGLPRPVTLKKNDKGIWKAYELSSLFLDVIGETPDKKVKDDI